MSGHNVSRRDLPAELIRAPKTGPFSPWWDKPAEVHQLLAWLVDTGRIRTLDEAVYYVEKPHKWHPEREEMLREQAMEDIQEQLECFEDDLNRRGAL